jgi:hypothetical protein
VQEYINITIAKFHSFCGNIISATPYRSVRLTGFRPEHRKGTARSGKEARSRKKNPESRIRRAWRFFAVLSVFVVPEMSYFIIMQGDIFMRHGCAPGAREAFPKLDVTADQQKERHKMLRFNLVPPLLGSADPTCQPRPHGRGHFCNTPPGFNNISAAEFRDSNQPTAHFIEILTL